MNLEQSIQKQPDAGLRSLNHYQTLLPRWRFHLRELFIPIVRWETPRLAALQARIRSQALDSYFASTANLGTHTFFMIILPILFWCGYVEFARGITQVLASGVFFSGFVKDLLCLPRPLSPPLQRISRSASAALEYGFPSTHSTNSVSVAVYAMYALQRSGGTSSRTSSLILQALCYFYATSIILGRLYCGMHGLFDVVVGTLLGAILAIVQCVYGHIFDDWIFEGPFKNVFIVTLFLVVLIRIHPEPADDCPCFDDSVAFSGVFIGIQIGAWHFARTDFSWSSPIPSSVPFDFQSLGWIKVLLRIMLGILIVFAWRGVMKPILLKILPPLFRVIEFLGLALPRKFFLRASQYRHVPPLRKDDNVIPPASEIPAMITSLRHPRKRTVSIGPQSEADAYEALAFRERKRRESLSRSPKTPCRKSPPASLQEEDEGYFTFTSARPSATESSTSTAISQRNSLSTIGEKANGRPLQGGVSLREILTKNEDVLCTPELPLENHVSAHMMDGAPTRSVQRNEPRLSVQSEETPNKQDQAVFLRLLRPRVRYDVEVVTKLIVYSGIAWLAVEGNPILFELCGLGVGRRPAWASFDIA